VDIIKYVAWNGSSWDTVVVDNQHNGYPSLALDTNDNPHISYYYFDSGSSQGDLRHATICRRPIVGDLNRDCYVNFEDFVTFASDWLDCANPFDSACDVP